MKKKYFLVCWLACLFVTGHAYGQNSNGYILWSATRRLQVNDFAIKTKQAETTPSFAQFTVDYEIHGFSFFTKNFNKKVHNYFMGSASWIDTTINVELSLRYQQTLFDICEVYTRQFRMALKDNRKQLLKGIEIAKELNQGYMSAFAKRRITYDSETAFGTDDRRQKEWELQIESELAALSNYAYDK